MGDYTEAAAGCRCEPRGVTEPVTTLSSHLLNVIFNSAQLCEDAVAQILDYSSREDADSHASTTAPLGKGMEKKRASLQIKVINECAALLDPPPQKPRAPTVAGERALPSAFVPSLF